MCLAGVLQCVLAHSSQSQAVSLRLAGLLLFQSDSDGLRGCLAGSVVLNVSGSPRSAAITVSTKRNASAKPLSVAVGTPVVWLHFNGGINDSNENKVDTFKKIKKLRL